MSTSIPPIVSVDDHVIEPPHVWSDWLPAKLRDADPKFNTCLTGSWTCPTLQRRRPAL